MTQAQVETISEFLAELEAREHLFRLSLADFMEMLARAGITAAPLTVQERKGRIDWRTKRPIHKVSWPRKRKFRLFGLTIAWSHRESGRFVKFDPGEVVMPLEAEVAHALVGVRPEVQEATVFVEVRTDPILAVRVDGHWLELYHWFTRAILRPEAWR